ncbi:MAG: CAP domain-containing protein [Dehalococcoidia bacterium]|nr:CAP domain-containing protein [Dehalococcoidia bacterium]
MKTRMAAFLAGSAIGLALLGFVLIVPSPQSAGAATNCAGGTPSIDAEEQAFLGLLNSYRAQNGLSALSLNPTLNQAAAWMANDLATNRYFAHADSLGRSPYRRAVDCGYAEGAGENLAGGTVMDTAQKAFDAWRGSPNHDANMLGIYYREVGIARHYDPASPYKWYWVTNFGAMQGGGAVATPTPSPTRTPTPTPTVAQTSTPSPVPTSTPPVATPTRTPAQPTPPKGTATPVASSTPAQPTSTATPRISLPLHRGANLVTWPGNTQSAQAALAPYADTVNMVYSYDPATQSWRRFAPGLPDYVNNMHRLEEGQAYWVIASGNSALQFTR